MAMTLDWNDAVFFKTPKAQEELADRRHGLRAKARQLLVMLDGSKPLGALTHLMSAHDLHALVRELKDSGFICDDSAPATPPVTPQPVSVSVNPPATKITTTETALDPVRLTRTKAYLIEISQQHLGLMAARLQQEIAAANDAASFRSALAHWNMALRESRSGSAVAQQHMKEAQALLQGTLPNTAA